MYQGFVIRLSKDEEFFNADGQRDFFFADNIRAEGEGPLNYCFRNRYQKLVVRLENRPQSSLNCVLFVSEDGELNMSVACKRADILSFEAGGYTEVRGAQLVHPNFKIFGSLQTFCKEETEYALWGALKELFALDAQASQSADISYKKALSARPWWRKLLGLPPART